MHNIYYSYAYSRIQDKYTIYTHILIYNAILIFMDLDDGQTVTLLRYRVILQYSS